jgi:hypothetical protein
MKIKVNGAATAKVEDMLKLLAGMVVFILLYGTCGIFGDGRKERG